LHKKEKALAIKKFVFQTLELPFFTKKSLGSGCHTLGRSLHEFFHALGFLHEHQRPDRDSFVDVHWENIRNGHAQDFAKVAQNQFVDNFVG